MLTASRQERRSQGDARKPFEGVDDDADGEEHLASTPLELTDAQRIAIHYRLRQLTECRAGSGLNADSMDVGLGWLNCDECDDDQKEDLGCWRFGNQLTAQHPTAIDYTGQRSHDKVNFCPKSLVDAENDPPGRCPGLVLEAGLQRFRKVKACGGLAPFLGKAPADCPPRVAWFYATVEGITVRYLAEVRDTQTRLSNKAISRLSQPKLQGDD